MIIQKFGGTAMKTELMRLKCIEHIETGIENHGKVVVVVSAMGRIGDPYATDSLLRLTDAFTSDKASSDLVASCGELIAASVLSAELKKAGIPNRILHGMQTGIKTSGEFGDAVIINIDTTNIENSFNQTNCIIIPGFQGMDSNGNVMTLGRGGSDLTAISLAAALYASHTEFYKDVPGVMTGDPRNNSNCKKYDTLSFDDFLLLLNCDRPIIQMRAALLAQKKAIPLYIRGTTGTEEGTWVVP
ncbi:amino acid kinase family protein [Sporosarcina sp. CAU 1771]